jgi:hypothetical protein
MDVFGILRRVLRKILRRKHLFVVVEYSTFHRVSALPSKGFIIVVAFGRWQGVCEVGGVVASNGSCEARPVLADDEVDVRRRRA